MALVGYHASHEQFAPGELLSLVQAAEAAGFGAGMCSDHLFPWSGRQGHSGFAWSWLGAALQATSLSFGVVTAPGYRYHPTIVAQAAATLEQMFPGRFWMAVGSGELLNEHVTGERWPPKADRNARLRECVDVARALWRGETVTHRGHVVVEEAKLYSLPDAPPPVIGAALSPETARWMGGWVDGLVTVNQPPEKLEAVVAAFREGGGGDKPVFLQVHVSWARDEAAARRQAHEQWSMPALPSSVLADLRLPAQFDAAAAFVRPDDLDASVRISADLARHAAWLNEYLEAGFERVMVHNVGLNQREFIEAFGAQVLPRLGWG
jgi:probable non-F420 flavinoid oxidoreductase